MSEEFKGTEGLKNLALAAIIALLSWGVLTIHQLAISTAELSKSVEYVATSVQGLPDRVTKLEVMVEELQNANRLDKR